MNSDELILQYAKIKLSLKENKKAFGVIEDCLDDNIAGYSDCIGIAISESRENDNYLGSFSDINTSNFCKNCEKKFELIVEKRRLKKLLGYTSMIITKAGIKKLEQKNKQER